MSRATGFHAGDHRFESGMVLVGGRDDLQDRVNIRPDSAPDPGVDINDAVKRLGGR